MVTFAVTAITARLPPISRFDNTSQAVEVAIKGSRLKTAWTLGVTTAQTADSVPKVLWVNFRDGVQMAAAIVPSILAIGLLGLLLSKYTPVFDVLGLLFYPFTALVGLSEPMTAAKGISSGLAEMFLPALLLASSDVLTRFVVAVVSVSSIIFFSAMIPCVLATKIPLSVGKLVIIWFLRTALSIVLAGLIGRLAIYFGYLVV